jgi:hypothetical protein
MTGVDVWVPTHRVSAGGAACWAAPDPATPALGVRLDPALEVRSVERRGDWMHVECANGWSTWVDARLMEQLVAAPPPPPPPPPSAPEATFHATHVVPAAGLAAFASHDASLPPVATLDPWLPVQVLERWGDWAQIACSNAWSAWVDGRLLDAASPAAAPQPAVPGPVASAQPRRNPLAAALVLLFSSPRSAGRAPLAAANPIALLGAALVAVGSALPLLTVEGFTSVSAWDTPAAFLVSDYPDPSSFKLGLLLVIAAVLTLLPLVSRRALPPVALLAFAAPATNTGVHLILLKARSGNQFPSLGPGAVMITVGGFLITASALWWAWHERRRAFQR